MRYRAYLIGSRDRDRFFKHGHNRHHPHSMIVANPELAERFEDIAEATRISKDRSYTAVAHGANTVIPVWVEETVVFEDAPEAFEIQVHRYLSPADFLIAFEVARHILGDPIRSERVKEDMDMTDEDAEEVFTHLTNFMNAVRQVQRKLEAPAGRLSLPGGE